MRTCGSTLLLALAIGGGCSDDTPSGDDAASTGTASDGTDGSTATGGSATTLGDTTSGTNPTSGTDPTSDTDPTADTGPGTTSDSSGGADSSGTTMGEGTTGGTGSDSGGVVMVDASIIDLALFQDCMPIVSPDPVGATFDLAIDNLGPDPVTATVVSATFDAGGAPLGTIDVVPDAYGPVDAESLVIFGVSKVAGSLVPQNGCNVLTCGGNFNLTLELDVEGTAVTAEGSGMMNCVF
jgi:hypothetical protein